MRFRIMPLEDRILLDASLPVDIQQVNQDSPPVPDAEVADMNNDGNPDVIAAEYAQGIENIDQIVVYENDGNGNFTENLVDDNLNRVNAIDVDDVDNDGDNDIVAINSNDGKINLYKNDGNGNFIKQMIGQVSGGMDVKIHDLNNDGNPEIIALGINQLAYFKNNGNGTFGLRQMIDDALIQGREIEIADFDNDGDNDIALTDRFDNSLSVFENDNLVFTKDIIDNNLSQVESISISDFDGDNDIDIFTSSLGDNEINYFENDGFGNFSKTLIENIYISPKEVGIADLDQDGSNDLILTTSAVDKVVLYDADFNFVEEVGTVDCAFGVNFADMDNDSKMDIVINGAEANNGELVWFKNLVEIEDNNPRTIIPDDPPEDEPEETTRYIDVVHLDADAGYKSSFWVSWEDEGELIEKKISEPTNEYNFVQRMYEDIEVPRTLELDFFIETTNNNSTWRHYADSEYGNLEINEDGFTVYFEDLPSDVADWDFNDQVFRIIENPFEEAVKYLKKAAEEYKIKF